MDIAPTLTMYNNTCKEFATKYVWWFLKIQAGTCRNNELRAFFSIERRGSRSGTLVRCVLIVLCWFVLTLRQRYPSNGADHASDPE